MDPQMQISGSSQAAESLKRLCRPGIEGLSGTATLAAVHHGAPAGAALPQQPRLLSHIQVLHLPGAARIPIEPACVLGMVRQCTDHLSDLGISNQMSVHRHF